MNKFDFVNEFDSVGRFQPQLGAMNDLVAAQSHAAHLFHPAAVAAEMITGHKHAADLVQQASAAAEMIAGHKHALDLFSDFRAASEVLQLHKELTAPTTSWREMMDVAKTYGVGDTVLNQCSRMSGLDCGLARFLPGAISEHWSAHLKLAAVPAISFLAHEWPEPVGLLAELAQGSLGASVSWLLRGDDEVAPMTAAVVPDNRSDEGSTVLVEVEPICALCGGPLVSLGRETVWVGPRRGIRRQRLFPACSKCFALEEEKPGTLLRVLADLTRPALRVINGGRRSDGTRRGVLRIVRADDIE